MLESIFHARVNPLVHCPTTLNECVTNLGLFYVDDEENSNAKCYHLRAFRCSFYKLVGTLKSYPHALLQLRSETQLFNWPVTTIFVKVLRGTYWINPECRCARSLVNRGGSSIVYERGTDQPSRLTNFINACFFLAAQNSRCAVPRSSIRMTNTEKEGN